MQFWHLLAVSVVCLAYSDVVFHETKIPEKKKSNVRSYISVDPDFDFVVYKDHETYDGNFFKCVKSIINYYDCKHKYYGDDNETHIRDSLGHWNDRLDNTNYLASEAPAVFLYTESSSGFSTVIGKEGTPGIWSCYYDKLNAELETILKEQKYQKNFPKTLFSGFADPVMFGITDENGIMKLKENDVIISSGFLSTTYEYDIAYNYATQRVSSSRTCFVLNITTLDKSLSQASGIGGNSQYGTIDSEYLYPTNVKFKVNSISSKTVKVNSVMVTLYEILVEELPLDHKFKVVEGKDPRHEDFEKIMNMCKSEELDCSFTPNKRKCAWNVEITCPNYPIVYKYWVNGRFRAMEIKDNQGYVTSHAVFRPDINNGTFVFHMDGSDTCKKGDENAGNRWAIVEALSFPSVFPYCEKTQYNGKNVMKYKNGYVTLYVDDDKEPVACSFGESAIYNMDFGSKAWMSDFSLRSNEKGCDDGAYKSGNDDFVFCAAGTVKAALSIVLATIAAVLVALF